MAAEGSSSRRTTVLVVTLIALSAILTVADVRWPLEDFVEYWAAGRLNAAGVNPYDPTALLHEQAQVGWSDRTPDMMYNPPWALAIAMPIGALDFQAARSIWLSVQILITLWCASQLWTLYGGASNRSTLAWSLALLWFPTMVAGRLGQISTVILLGLVGFLVCVSARRDLAAGMFFAMTAVKPQLVALVWVPVMLWALADRRFKVLAGVAVALLGASLAALAANPAVFAQYLHLMTSAPPQLSFESPNVATVLRVALRTQGTWPQYVPMLVGAAGVAVLWYRRRATWEWHREMPGLVLLSCLLTSYGGWTCDLVVLLVPIVSLAVAVERSGRASLWVGAGAAFAAVSALGLALHQLQVPQAAFIWMTPAVTIAWLALSRSAAPAEAWSFTLSASGNCGPSH